MPSLPALPVKNHALRDVATTNTLYNKATREYLNRNFSGCLATIAIHRAQPQSLKSKKKMFLLYVAVIDTMTTSMTFAEIKRTVGQEGVVLCDRMRDGMLWEEAERYFSDMDHEGTLTTLPIDVATTLILSFCRHLSDHATLQGLVEAYLTQIPPESPDHDTVSELYALHVLPRCQLWEDAEKYIDSCDLPDPKRHAWLEALRQRRIAEEEEEARLVKAAEDAKQAESDAKNSKKVRKSSRRGGSKKSTTSTAGSVILPETVRTPSSHPAATFNEASSNNNTTTTTLKSFNGEGGKTVNDPSTSAAAAASSSSSPSSALLRWTNSLSFLTLLPALNRRTIQLLLFLALLFGATGRRQVRERVKRALSLVGTTVMAGFKVSYI